MMISISREYWRETKAICEKIKMGSEKIGKRNNQNEMIRVPIHIYNYASSVEKLRESNIFKQITKHWDKKIVKSLLLRLILDVGVEFEISKAVQASEAEIDLENRGTKKM